MIEDIWFSIGKQETCRHDSLMVKVFKTDKGIKGLKNKKTCFLGFRGTTSSTSWSQQLEGHHHNSTLLKLK